MRIAFVGKGGSGKSTISALFFLNLLNKNKRAIIFDADLNIHIPDMLGVSVDPSRSLSNNSNKDSIKKYLIGNSNKIKSVGHFYKTTPPSLGCNFFTLDMNNLIVSSYSTKYKNGYISTVGTYQDNEIGTSCYHVNLSILENILTFSNINKEDWIVTDMVAGIDAFANTLHQQFDLICLVIEPTIESISVYKQYMELSKEAGVGDRVFVVGNKIEDEADENFIRENVNLSKILGFLTKNSNIKNLRRDGKKIGLDALSKNEINVLNKIETKVNENYLDPNSRLKEIHKLHLKYSNQSYVKNSVGDISDQIDSDFKYK